MWTRFLLKCENCDKVTNLRVQIPECQSLPISFDCIGCSSELRGTLFIKSTNENWDFKVERGSLIKGDFFGGDYFYEFSDTMRTSKPSEIPHKTEMPTIRMDTKDFMNQKLIKDVRKIHNQTDWDDLKDLAKAYAEFNKPLIKKLVTKIIKENLADNINEYNSDLDYIFNYHLALNNIVFPWIDFENHSAFVKWLNTNIFNKDNIKNSDFIDYIQNIATVEVCNNIKREISELIIRFADLRNYFYYANNVTSIADEFAGAENFNHIKSFYTDCFEFTGRTSHLIFRLQNYFERGGQNLVPKDSPRNVTDALSFQFLDHGKKLDLLLLSTEEMLKLVYVKSFDNKLRNGINHFKAKIEKNTQTIYYYPITSKPDEVYKISYIDFLHLTLDIFNSVLKMGQLIKLITIYRSILKTV